MSLFLVANTTAPNAIPNFRECGRSRSTEGGLVFLGSGDTSRTFLLSLSQVSKPPLLCTQISCSIVYKKDHRSMRTLFLLATALSWASFMAGQTASELVAKNL